MATDREHHKGLIEELVDDMTTDPDAPDKGNASPPPQTIDAEPSSRKDRAD